MQPTIYNNDEHDIHTILNTFQYHPSVKKILERNDVKVYDLGYGLPDFLYSLYHMYDCIDLIVGVEQYWVNIKAQTNGTGLSMYDLYKFTMNLNPNWMKSKNKNILSVENYVKHFNLLYRHNIYSFFKMREYRNEMCDYMILSNFIHLMGHEPTFLEDCTSKLKVGGLIYARANHQFNKKSIENNHVAYSEECFINLFNNAGFDMIYSSVFEYSKEDENGTNIKVEIPTMKEGILYFGVKR